MLTGIQSPDWARRLVGTWIQVDGTTIFVFMTDYFPNHTLDQQIRIFGDEYEAVLFDIAHPDLPPSPPGTLVITFLTESNFLSIETPEPVKEWTIKELSKIVNPIQIY